MPWKKQFDVDLGLERAMQAFWERGYEATSMQDLVEAMGINRGSLYDTYGDKRALFLAALRNYDENIRREPLERLEVEMEPRQAIRTVFEILAEPAMDGSPAKGCLLTNSALELAAHDAEIREIIARSQRQIEEFFARVIERGKAEGVFGPHVEANQAAAGLIAAMLGLIVLTRSRPEPELLKSITDDALSRLL
jgi:TetR/AcrR family transcriptional repressor of nem operon